MAAVAANGEDDGEDDSGFGVDEEAGGDRFRVEVFPHPHGPAPELLDREPLDVCENRCFELGEDLVG